MNDAQKRTLLSVARQTVEAAVQGFPPPPLRFEDPELNRPCGAFVTVKTRGRLRGCIGRFTADKPLWQTVQDMAEAAVTKDDRFFNNRLQLPEVPGCHIEISILSPLERIEDPLSLELGTHGIDIRKGGRRGCYLPQVATEFGWSKERFLSDCCQRKAFLAPDAWKDPDTEVYVFTAEIIQE